MGEHLRWRRLRTYASLPAMTVMQLAHGDFEPASRERAPRIYLHVEVSAREIEREHATVPIPNRYGPARL